MESLEKKLRYVDQNGFYQDIVNKEKKNDWNLWTDLTSLWKK